MLSLSIASKAEPLRAHLERRRAAYFSVFFVLFLAGVAFSLSALQVKLSWVFAGWVALDFFVLAPAAVAAAASNLQASAALFGVKSQFGKAFAATAAGVVADLAPLPGGYLARGAVLVSAGIKLKHCGAALFVSSMIGLALAAGAAAGVFWEKTLIATSLVALTGLIVGVCGLWCMRRPQPASIAPFILSKTFGYVLLLLRVEIAMRAIGCDAALSDIILLVFASMAGGFAPLTPGGLGLREGLAAAMAAANGFSPAAAFLAMSVMRMVASASCALYLGLREARRALRRDRAIGSNAS